MMLKMQDGRIGSCNIPRQIFMEMRSVAELSLARISIFVRLGFLPNVVAVDIRFLEPVEQEAA